MALLSKKEFAGQTGQTTKTLATYVTRKKVVVRKDGLIDTNNETNRAFIAAHGWKEPVKGGHLPKDVVTETSAASKKVVKGVVNDSQEEPGDADTEELMPISKSERHYKHYQALKTEAEERLAHLKIKKLQGDVVPVDPIEQLIFRYKQHMLTEQKAIFEAFLNEIAHKYSITGEDIAMYKGIIIKKLNDGVQDATRNTLRELDVVLNEFTIKRGKGERV